MNALTWNEIQADNQSSEPVARDAAELVKKGLFLRVSYGKLGNTKKVAGEKVLVTEADKALLKVSKQLIDSPELEAIGHHDSRLRKWLSGICLPFLDWPGVLIVPKPVMQRVWTRLLAHREERVALVSALVAAYAGLVEKAKEALGPEFNSTDYLPVEEVASRFRFYWAVRTFETPDDLKEVSEEIYAEQKAATQAQFSAAMEEISSVLRQKALELFTHLRDKLQPSADGKPKVLRQPTIDALKEFMDNMDFRNIGNDEALAEQVQKARELLGDETAVTLKTNNEFRNKVLAGMTELSENLSALVQDAPERKFRLEGEEF